MSRAYLQELSVALEKQLFWLDYSYQQVKDLSKPEHFSIEQFNQFANLCSRYARTIDFLVRKVFRCLDDVEFENQGTLIDVVNHAHKRGLFEDIESIRQIKDIRNEIVHEYLDEALQSVFSDVLRTAPELIAIGRNTLAHVEKVNR
ncbi:hypothetical protein [methanotrophic endosymbiont of Bathymodiolus puteoserpentis (Logatchev)]|jgi:hypothetical protein|uniref:hypothetical protein n=1 Tax=methanotrophic endosymbiont of Bathymodiolus puteoserpentis (Logatchev) TaxID=343235 RepID=UPI0013C547D9|nr:hypothetical protein [methanotrophic endosymbiont of Bathymodiolus puteoserpentis (Logatchev)]SHE20522.1 hypothetical protein BPUTEOMOX_339 [methanotrophic endosymbiont of Bathymodiolus puteoserpentis (Logatchev)]